VVCSGDMPKKGGGIPGREKRVAGSQVQDAGACMPARPEPPGASVCIRRAGCECADCRDVGAIEAALQQERLRASMRLLEQEEREQDTPAPAELLPPAATPAHAGRASAPDAPGRCAVDAADAADAAALISPAVSAAGEREQGEPEQDPAVLGVLQPRRLSQAEPGGWSQWGQDSEEDEGPGDEGSTSGDAQRGRSGCQSQDDDDARVFLRVDARSVHTPHGSLAQDSVPPVTCRECQPEQQHGLGMLEPGTGGDGEEAPGGAGAEAGRHDQVLPSECAGNAHAQAPTAPCPAAHAPRPPSSAPRAEQEEEREQAGVQKGDSGPGEEEVRGAQTISDLLRSRSWKERLEALDMLKDKAASAASTLSDNVSDTCREEVELVVAAVGDSNIAVQERALDVALTLCPTAAPGLMEAWGSELAGVAIDKAFGQSKCKGKAQHVLLALLGRPECSGGVLDLLAAACAHKQPKVATSRSLRPSPVLSLAWPAHESVP